MLAKGGDGMHMISLHSSLLVAAAYNAGSGELCLRFRIGLYVYRNVPPTVYTDLMKAPSHSQYFRTNIKDRYARRRID